MKGRSPSAVRMVLVASCCSISLVILMISLGCGGGSERTDGGSQKVSTSVAEVSETATPPSAKTPNAIQGSIIEAMNSGGYTYILVQTPEEQIWAAGPLSEVEVGEMVVLPQGMPMRDFHSKTLDRTFEIIYFVPSFDAQRTGGDPHDSMNQLHAGSTTPPDRDESGSGNEGGSISGTRTYVDRIVHDKKIEKPPGGHTIGEIYARKEELNKRMVKVRGIVVKFTPAIMGTNWLHMQDGTGTDRTYDLTVTTDATVSFGDMITIQGILAVNKDFGAGYQYDVIIEDADLISD